jgi:hypothetical protein
MRVLICCTSFVGNLSKKKFTKILQIRTSFHVKYPLLNSFDTFFKNIQTSYVTEIGVMGADLFHTDRPT